MLLWSRRSCSTSGCSRSELAGHADLVSGMRNVSPCVSVFNFSVTEGKSKT